MTQAQCGNKICRSNPGICNNGCVCCVYPNGNSRCRPPQECTAPRHHRGTSHDRHRRSNNKHHDRRTDDLNDHNVHDPRADYEDDSAAANHDDGYADGGDDDHLRSVPHESSGRATVICAPGETCAVTELNPYTIGCCAAGNVPCDLGQSTQYDLCCPEGTICETVTDVPKPYPRCGS